MGTTSNNLKILVTILGATLFWFDSTAVWAKVISIMSLMYGSDGQRHNFVFFYAVGDLVIESPSLFAFSLIWFALGHVEFLAMARKKYIGELDLENIMRDFFTLIGVHIILISLLFYTSSILTIPVSIAFYIMENIYLCYYLANLGGYNSTENYVPPFGRNYQDKWVLDKWLLSAIFFWMCDILVAFSMISPSLGYLGYILSIISFFM